MDTIILLTTLAVLGVAWQSSAPQSVLAPGAHVEKAAGGFIFTEGPTSDRNGNVFFVDQDNNRILEYDTTGKLTTFLQPSGYANGMTFDPDGHLIAAADEKNEMWSIDVATKKATVLFGGAYEGKLLNGPNDVWVDPQTRRIYFTDPYYQRKWWSRGPKESPEAVYVYFPKDRRLLRLIEDLSQPNGIIGTPDGKTLYVADIRGQKTYAYDIQADGRLANQRLFVDLGSDGMTIDSEGNLYLTTGPKVHVVDRSGRDFETIDVPEAPSNVCFGGADQRTLFITARTSLYTIRTRVHGVGPQ
jgi:gluconolactonase